MQLAQKIVELEQALVIADTDGKRVGFIPTMGALHKGHFVLGQKSSRPGFVYCGVGFREPSSIRGR